MFDHIGFTVKDVEASRKFYVAALAPLGVGVVEWNPPATSAWAATESRSSGSPGAIRPPRPCIWRSAARNRAEVDAFHAAALEAGARDNGAPGLRPHYHPNYYGAFAIDPDGHNIEAVCHSAEP